MVEPRVLGAGLHVHRRLLRLAAVEPRGGERSQAIVDAIVLREPSRRARRSGLAGGGERPFGWKWCFSLH
jgi:hypothetical protein